MHAPKAQGLWVFFTCSDFVLKGCDRLPRGESLMHYTKGNITHCKRYNGPSAHFTHSEGRLPRARRDRFWRSMPGRYSTSIILCGTAAAPHSSEPRVVKRTFRGMRPLCLCGLVLSSTASGGTSNTGVLVESLAIKYLQLYHSR